MSYFDDAVAQEDEKVVVSAKALAAALNALRRSSDSKVSSVVADDLVKNAMVQMQSVDGKASADDKSQEQAWEYFMDEGYFDWWAVRRTQERRWAHCYYVPSKREAIKLCNKLNRLETQMSSPVVTEAAFGSGLIFDLRQGGRTALRASL